MFESNSLRPSLFVVLVLAVCFAGQTAQASVLVACRSEFVTADAAGGVGVFPLDRPSIGGVGVDVAAKFAS